MGVTLSKLLALVISWSLAACSSKNISSPQQLAQNMHNLVPLLRLRVASPRQLALPKAGRNALNVTNFQTLDNIYKQQSHSLLISEGAVVTDLY